MPAQPFEAGQAVADGPNQGRLARDRCQLAMEPCFKIINERCCHLLPDRRALIGGDTNGSFDPLQRCHAFQSLFGNAGAIMLAPSRRSFLGDRSCPMINPRTQFSTTDIMLFGFGRGA